MTGDHIPVENGRGWGWGVPSTLSQDLSASPEGEVNVVDLRKEGVCATALREPLYLMRGDIKRKIFAMSLFFPGGCSYLN